MANDLFLQTLAAYDFELPQEQIAQFPASPRESSRLLVVHRKTGVIEHRQFTDLIELINESDQIVVNNTQVIRARLLGRRIAEGNGNPVEAGKIEFFMLEEKAPRTWEGLFHASAKYKAGLKFKVPTPDGLGLHGILVRGSGDSTHGTVVAEFDRDPLESGAGEVPLPPYVDRTPTAGDEFQYQTVFAKIPGSAAAPTAALHFSEELVRRFKARCGGWDEVTLNVGLGTFRPVKDDDLSKHLMHEESFQVSDSTAEHVNRAKNSGKRIFAVGTTSVRTLESAWKKSDENSLARLESGSGRTSIFIRPGYEFQVVDRLLTNFHLPRSTLLMLVCAFGGRDLILKAYDEAVKHKYRFFSYGDAMVIL
ncbi:MAG: tRNA preQ1(34) S-adenosylmethionine ribosyltransferase-isomerase QueA [Bdellovibrionota bacterium]